MDKMKHWNMEVFGNIFNKKKCIIARLVGIQRALEIHNSRNLSALENQLKKDLDDVMAQEELLWFQKSRQDWLFYGDRNTSFFHNSTLQRRRRNKITYLKDENGVWLNDTVALKNHAIKFFANIYTVDGSTSAPYQLVGYFPAISPNLLLDFSQLKHIFLSRQNH